MIEFDELVDRLHQPFEQLMDRAAANPALLEQLQSARDGRIAACLVLALAMSSYLTELAGMEGRPSVLSDPVVDWGPAVAELISSLDDVVGMTRHSRLHIEARKWLEEQE